MYGRNTNRLPGGSGGYTEIPQTCGPTIFASESHCAIAHAAKLELQIAHLHMGRGSEQDKGYRPQGLYPFFLDTEANLSLEGIN